MTWSEKKTRFKGWEFCYDRVCRINLLWFLFVSFKGKAASSVASEAVRPRWAVSSGLMPGLMEYVSPINPFSRVWLGLPAREAALILAPHPADSELHSEQLIRHGAVQAAQDRCRDEERRFESPTQPEWPASNALFCSFLEDWYFCLYSQMSFNQPKNWSNYFIQPFFKHQSL